MHTYTHYSTHQHNTLSPIPKMNRTLHQQQKVLIGAWKLCAPYVCVCVSYEATLIPFQAWHHDHCQIHIVKLIPIRGGFSPSVYTAI